MGSIPAGSTTSPMAKEIERKYLVDPSDLDELLSLSTETSTIKIIQGYLHDTAPEVRVRKWTGDFEGAAICVKGNTNGIIRDEFEYVITTSDADQMLAMCPIALTKTRHSIVISDVLVEVNVFDHPLSNLIIAEIEMMDEKQRAINPLSKNGHPLFAKDISAALDAEYYSGISLARAAAPLVDN